MINKSHLPTYNDWVMRVHRLSVLAHELRVRSIRWLTSPRIVFRLRRRQRFAHRYAPGRGDD